MLRVSKVQLVPTYAITIFSFRSEDAQQRAPYGPGSKSFEERIVAHQKFRNKTVSFIHSRAYLFEASNRVPVQCIHLSSQQQLNMYLLLLHLCSRNTSNHFFSQPKFPLQRRSLLCFNISFNSIHTDLELAPGNAVGIGRNIEVFEQSHDRFTQP